MLCELRQVQYVLIYAFNNLTTSFNGYKENFVIRGNIRRHAIAAQAFIYSTHAMKFYFIGTLYSN